MITFSIITITYNASQELPSTLSSVMAQTCKDVEHIIIDGASTDNTVALAEAYRSKSQTEAPLHRVIIVSEPDKGLYDAMNKGIAMATGDYVLFLNAGDTFPAADTLEMVEASVGDGEELPAVLYGDTDIVDADGNFLRHRHLMAPRKLSWRSFMKGMLVCHQAFYARTDLAKLTPYNLDYRYSADVDWCIRIMRLGAKRNLAMRNTGMVVAHYLDGGMTNQHHKDSLRERFHVMRRHYGLIPTTIMHVWFALRNLMRSLSPLSLSLSILSILSISSILSILSISSIVY